MPIARPSRRQLLIGGGIGIGLSVGWALWPREHDVQAMARAGETALGGWLRIAESGVVTVMVPQAENGQGVSTALPQILADELGADWRTIAVEPAPLSALYANRLFAHEAGGAAAGEWAARSGLMITAASSSIRAFEAPLREAGATARALLCKAAAARWGVAWSDCDTQAGFVVAGDRRERFGVLAAEAARLEAPDPPALRIGGEDRLAGQPLPRLDTPAKIDGSARFAGDIRLPDMVFAAIRQGPPGHGGAGDYDRAAAEAMPGVLAAIRTPRWVAAVGVNWWAANQALDAMRPRFAAPNPTADSAAIARALDAALDGEGRRLLQAGDLSAAFAGQRLRTADYAMGLAVHGALETPAATARFADGRLELWIATDAPLETRAQAAQALGIAEAAVTLHRVPGGGSFGRRLDGEVGAQAAILAAQMQRPVQLSWSRAEDLTHDRYRAPARMRAAARLGPAGRVEGLLIKIAAPEPDLHAVLGPAARVATPPRFTFPYAIPALAIDHHSAVIGWPTGHARGGWATPLAFVTESLVDELAAASGIEALSFRIQMLTANPRLARCLSTAAALGGWEGGATGAGQGLAGWSTAGSHVALLAEARFDERQRVRVTRVVAAVDVGRVINPNLVRQQIEGGILWGLAAATGAPVDVEDGKAVPRNFAQLEVPRLASAPEIIVELLRSNEPSGGASEIAVPPIAPAIANALAAGGGRRPRALPLSARG